MPTPQVLIHVVSQPHIPDMVGPTLDAIAIENQATNKPTVGICDVHAIDYFYKLPRKEPLGGRPRWRWVDSVSSKIEDNGSYKTEDGLVFDLASHAVKIPNTHIIC